MSVIQNRDDRLSNLIDGIESTGLPLLRKLPCDCKAVEDAVADYLLFCNKIARTNTLNLPNRTPNGIIVPKFEVMESYYKLHQAVVDIVDSMHGLKENIDLIHDVITVRVSSGFQDPDLHKRPRASTKIHSDIWSGEFTNTVMAFIPIIGDFEKNGIRFYETPETIYPQYIKTLYDYNEAAELCDNLVPYNVILERNNLYLTDPFLLHNTVKEREDKDAYRVSIDFRFTTKFTCDSDINTNTDRKKDYIPYKDWAEIGKTIFLRPKNSIFDYIPDVTKNSYAAEFDLLYKKD